MHKTLKHDNSSEFDLYDDVEKIKSALKDASRDVKGKAAEMLAESLLTAEQKSALLKANLSDYVEEKPLQALGLAALVGLILGFLISK